MWFFQYLQHPHWIDRPTWQYAPFRSTGLMPEGTHPNSCNYTVIAVFEWIRVNYIHVANVSIFIASCFERENRTFLEAIFLHNSNSEDSEKRLMPQTSYFKMKHINWQTIRVLSSFLGFWTYDSSVMWSTYSWAQKRAATCSSFLWSASRSNLSS